MAVLVLSQSDRLILHLSEMDRHRDDPEAPIGVSQEGISQRLGTGIHVVSRTLSSLEKDGLVTGELAHIRGAPKRRKAYYLTEKGKQAAMAIRTDISKRPVVLEHGGKAQEMTFDEAVKRLGFLTGYPSAFYDVVEVARVSDTIRTEAFLKLAPAKKLGREVVERSHGRPRIESFFGRDAEKKAILEKIADQSTAAILLWGLPGIGKSTLASKVFEEISGKRPMLWYSFREWDTESTFISALEEFLSAQGKMAVADRRSDAIPELFMPLVGDLSGCNAVLFLDDIQKCSTQVLPLLSMVTEATRASKSSKVLLISRAVPSFFSTVSPGNASIELGGLDRDSAWHMAQSLKAKDSVRIVDESHGHPLLLNLMARSGVSRSSGDVSGFIEREIYSAVTDKERVALEMLSVFRHPVPVDALPETDLETVSSLKQKALVFEQEEGIATHDLIKEFLIGHLDAQKKQRYHGLAGAYCELNPEVEWKLETLFHFVEAGDLESSRRVAIAYASELAKDFPEESLALISKVPLKEGAHKENAEILFIRGQLHDELGKEQAALADFEQSIALLGKEAATEKRALVIETMAKLQGRVQKWSESLKGHEDALRLYERSNDKAGQIREWMNIGSVLRRKGDTGRARDAFERALKLASMLEDRPAQAACLNNLGLLDRDEGRLREAESRIKESIRLARAVKDYSGEARGLENLAELYRAELRSDEMTSLLLESSEAFVRSEELQEAKRVQAVCAEAFGAQGRYVEAVALAEKALERPDLRRRKGLFRSGPAYDLGDLAISSALIDLHRAAGDPKKAQKELNRYFSMGQSIGDRGMIARGKLLQAIILEDLDQLVPAVKALAEAESALMASGNSEGLIAVHMRAGALEEKLGNLASARRHYESAARQSELSGNDYAHHLAMERSASLKKPSAEDG